MINQGKLTRYSASAGSGKTFKLAGIYLDYLFLEPGSYRSILAVTFTNKAASEMKERILNTLFQLATGSDSDYLDKLLILTGKDHEWIRVRSLIILKNILHDYSRFSVGTIDSFFQKVLRAFVKESGLHAGFNLVLDHSVILSEAVDEMLMSVDQDEDLKKWLIDYSQYEISEGKHWDLKGRIMELGEEIFKEEFRLLFNTDKIVSDKKILKEGMSLLIALERNFSNNLSRLSQSALNILNSSGVEMEDLRDKNRSLKKFLSEAISGVPDKLSASIRKAWEQELYYSGSTPPQSVAKALSEGLHQEISRVCEYYEAGITDFKSSRLVAGNLFNLGILTDISDKVRAILNNSNKFLLSDAGDLLGQIIERDQAPFIYEKVGTRYTNYMIDEFQDTSFIQWRNFEPLIRNSISEGDSNLVVGDVKQAIYRWRNSDWRILDRIDSEFDTETFFSDTLSSNWRSCSNIIEFNNRLFSYLPELIENKLELDNGAVSSLYSEVVQEDPGNKKDGFVRLEEISQTDKKHQKLLVLEKIPGLIEEIQDNGYSAGDIGILVRKNSEGQDIISALMEYSAGIDEAKRKKYTYQVISQDSLFLVNSPVIQFILSALEYIVDRSNRLAYISMVHFLSLLRGDYNKDSRPVLLESDLIGEEFDGYIDSIRYMPVFDIVDRLINFFNLGSFEAGIPFLNTLQDMILDLSSTETNDIPFFIEWWNNEGYKKSVASPDQDDSIQLMTIHKSKGLQFKVVIVPFLSWSLGHGMSSSIWVYSDNEPFKRLGAVPVRYKQEIADTHFKKYYDREKLNVAIDKLNLLYVALTRSEECLYGFIPTGVKRDTSIGTLMIDAIFDGKSEYITGTVPVKESSRDLKISDKGAVIPYNVTISEDRLNLKVNSYGYLSEDVRDETQLSYGLLMHDVLSRIRTSEDIEAALQYSLLNGEISLNQKRQLFEGLQRKLTGPVIKEWFSAKYECWREKDIILPGGEIKRPDRVVIFDDYALVIDFKFGRESSMHIAQVKEYMIIVGEILGKKVEGALWYVDSDKIVDIKSNN